MSVLHRLSAAWSTVATTGWSDHSEDFRPLYPMPGHPGFDDDERFLQQPLFPKSNGGVVRVSDMIWEFPLAWMPHYETRPDSWRRICFEARLSEKTPTLVLAWKRAVYLEMFRSRRPLAPSTLRKRSKVYGAFVTYAVESGVDIRALGYVDLAEVVGGLGKFDRKVVRAVYDGLRWWRSQPGTSYSFFDPPPSIDAVDKGMMPSGLDTTRMRKGDAEDDPSQMWQPFPDAFVAALGELALALVENVRPVVNDCCRQLATLRRAWSPASYRKKSKQTIRSYNWPNGLAPLNELQLRALALDCQTAAHMLISLLLGPRASELLALPGVSLRQIGSGENSAWVIDGTTFKRSQNFGGDLRDWPLHPIAAAILVAQREYVDITEGGQFSWLWKSHVTIFNTASPVKQIWHQLNDFLERYQHLRPLLDGKSFHHHRFRKTTARLIVIALHGGPLILRRLFGHEHLAMTLRYILADDSIVTELKEIAEEEQRRIAAELVSRKGDILGRGGEIFRQTVSAAIEMINITVPDGSRDQAEVKTDEIVALLTDGAQGSSIKQILPGLIHCIKPFDEAGVCCAPNELPNVARCSAECIWHMMLKEFEHQAIENVRDSLSHLATDPDNPLIGTHYVGVVRYWTFRFPDRVRKEFAGNSTFEAIVRELNVPHG